MNPHGDSAAGPRRALARDREAVVVESLHRLAPFLDGEPDPAFRAATRARLVAMAAVRAPAPEPVSGVKRLLAGRVSDVRAPRWRTRLTAGLAGAALTVTALATLVAVADGARPGDVLYGIKRGTEQTQLALAGDSRGETLLDLAGTRLAEVGDLVGGSATALPAATTTGPGTETVLAAGVDPTLVLETLRTMDDETTQGTVWLTGRALRTQGTGPLDKLSSWATGQSAGLKAVQPLVPAAAANAVTGSLTLLTDIATRVEGLRSAVTCPGAPAVNGTDALGPVPGLCLPPARSAGGPDAGTAATVGSGTGSEQQPPAPTPTTAPPATGTTSGGIGTGILPTTVDPATSAVPSPGGGLLPSLPSLPLPTPPGGSVLDVPRGLPLPVCLPPLATLGNC